MNDRIIERIIKPKVAGFRQENGLGANDPIKMQSLLIKLNIITVFKDLSDSFSGMALKLETQRYMLINSLHAIGRQNFTICHELYHLFKQDNFEANVCHPGSSNKKEIEEWRADKFAALLLMPEDGVLEMIPTIETAKNKIKLGTILEIEQTFGCSRIALLHRLSEMDIIDERKVAEYKVDVKKNAKLYGFNTKLYEPGRNNLVFGHYGKKVKELFDKDVISETNFISLMLDIGIDISENLGAGNEQDGV